MSNVFDESIENIDLPMQPSSYQPSPGVRDVSLAHASKGRIIVFMFVDINLCHDSEICDLIVVLS